MKNVMWTVSKRAILAAWIAGAMVAPALAQDGSSASDPKANAAKVDEVVVTGVRASLDRALGQKRRADTIVDGISSEDIADFPDGNISESLQRIASVTITRNNGEGELVSIRGLAPQFTKVTLGGLPVLAVAVSDDGNVQNGRATNFDVFPSELFTNALVYKTPSAEVSDGGLAGTIDLDVPRAFDFSGRQIAASLAARHSSLGEETNPQGTLLFSDRFADDKIGVLVQAAYAEDFLYSGVSEGTRWFNTFNFDLDRNGTNEFTNVEVGRLPRLMEEHYDRERLGASASIQFRPTDAFDFGIDVLFAESTKERTRHQLALNLFGAFTPTALTVDANNSAVRGTFTGVGVRSGFDYNTIETENLIVGAHGDWRITETLNLAGRLSLSRANFDRNYYTFNAEAAGRTVSYDFAADPRYALISSSNLDFNDASQFRMLPSITHQPIAYEAVAQFGRLDLNWDIQSPAFSAMKFGVEYNDQTHDRDQFRGTYAVPAGSILSLGIGAPLRRDLFPDDGPSGVTRGWAAFDRDAALRVLTPANPKPVVDPQLTYEIEEAVTSAYAQADIDAMIGGLSIGGNLGMRYSSTEQSTEGFATQGAVVRAVRYERSYDDFLPSLNLRADLSEDVVLRLAASRSVTRANLTDLAPSETVSAVNPTVTRGNPELEPYRANQADLSLEWYFAPEAVLSAAIFYKSIQGFVTTQAVTGPYTPIFDPSRAGNFLQTTPINGDDATVTGIELNFQQPLTFLPTPFDGFGVFANLTYSDSEATSTSVVNNATVSLSTTLPGQSKYSYNLVGYYEKGPFSARLAYHYRDDFLVLILGGVEQRFQEGGGNLDMSVSFEPREGLNFFFEGLNLTSEDIYRYDRTTSRNVSFADFGSTFTAGVRAKF